MKNILIISYFFAPANMMGAVRGTKLAKYLKRLGYNVTVICSEDNKILFMPGDIKEDITLKKDIECIEYIKIEHSKIYKNLSNKLLKINNKLFPQGTIQDKNNTNKRYKDSLLKKQIKNFIHLITFLLILIQDYDFRNSAIKYMREENINLEKYDIVLSTYGPFGSHALAEKIKDKYKIKWIADFRDPMINDYKYSLKNFISNYLQNRVCKKADFITAISKGNLDMITKNLYNNKSSVIMNGYDLEDIKKEKGFNKSDKFSLVYTGTTYAGKRDLSPIFRAISDLIAENKIDENKIVFNYAGTQSSYVYQQAKKYNVDNIVNDYGYISRTEAINLQNKSELLVVATWNEVGHKGVLPGKFLEYMSYKKNILGITSGEVENSEMNSMINDYNLGISYEQINSKEQYKLLKEYIYIKYEEWLDLGYCKYNGNIEKVNSHDYKEIAMQFINIFNKVS